MSKRLYIGNLSFATTEEKLKEVFSQYGSPASVELVVDRDTNQSKGFAFVEYENDSDSDALSAIAALNGRELDGRYVRVEEASVRRPKNEDRRSDRDRERNYDRDRSFNRDRSSSRERDGFRRREGFSSRDSSRERDDFRGKKNFRDRSKTPESPHKNRYENKPSFNPARKEENARWNGHFSNHAPYEEGTDYNSENFTGFKHSTSFDFPQKDSE